MLRRNPWYVAAIALISLSGAVVTAGTLHPLWVAIATAIPVLVVGIVVTVLAFAVAFTLGWALLLLNRHTVVFINDWAALGIQAAVGRDGTAKWQVMQHVAREPRGHGKRLRLQIAPAITAAADDAAVPITATAVNRKVLGIYIDTPREFEVELAGGRRLIRRPRSSHDVSAPRSVVDVQH